MPTPTPLGRQRLWPAALVSAISLGVYLRTLCPTVFVDGTGENIVSACTLGVPHPPGFPLFCLLAKAFSLLLPVGSAAYSINLFAAVLGAVAAGGLYLLLSAVGLRTLPAVAAALAFAFSATFWRQATIAEVYTLSLSLIILQIALLVHWRKGLPEPAAPAATQPAPAPKGKQKRRAPRDTPTRKPRRAGLRPHDRPLLWLAFTFGLGLTVHYNHLLLLPAYLYFLLAHDRSLVARWRVSAVALLAAASAFSLHLYAPLRSLANPPLDWGNPESLTNWWRYLTAAQYRGRMFSLPPARVLANLHDFLADLPAEFWWLGLAAALAGAVILFRRDRALFWMTALIVFTAALWSINYDIPWEIEVYYLPALLAMAIWIAFALHSADQWLRARKCPQWLSLSLLAVPALALTFNFGPNDLSRQRFVMDNALDLLDTVEPEAALLLPSTNPTFALIYLTRVEGAAPGLDLWKQEARGLLPIEQAIQPTSQEQRTPAPQFLAESLSRGRPVYAIDRQPEGALVGFAQIPWGCLYRLVPADQREFWLDRAPADIWRNYRFQPADQRFIYGSEQALIAGRYLLVQGDYAWEIGDHNSADASYQRALAIGASLPSIAAQLGQRYTEQGRTELAVSVYRQALADHEDAVIHNSLGAIYGRQNRLDEAETHFLRALALKPDFADARANLASVYGRRGEIDRAIAELELALEYDPTNLLALKNLSLAYANLGRRDEARDLLRRALAINPAQEDLREALRLLEQPR